jgi:uncharacterized protein (TIGR00369 family)
MQPDRTRTVTWDDPSAGPAVLAQLSGIEFMQALAEQRLPKPPMMHLMNMTLESVASGEVVFSADPDESHYNPLGIVHGGFACTVLDTVVGCAVHTTLPQGLGYTSLDLNVSYLSAITTGSGRLTATGRIVKPGKRVAFAEGEIVDATGRRIATATSTLLVFPIGG